MAKCFPVILEAKLCIYECSRPCRMLGPVLEQLAADRPDVTVAKVDVDENMSLAAAYGVESIPMLLVFKSGQLVNKSIGFVSQPEIEKLLQ